jgi:pyrimidine operon attenuation protein/uracil phosphoribosyltransferase
MNILDIDVDELIQSIAHKVKNRSDQSIDYKIIGIQTGGVWIAERLRQQLNIKEPIGLVNTAFYRDDFETQGLYSNVVASDISWEVDGAHVLLVDDVLYTGRTVRGALNEIFDFGRPASVTLVTLVNRTGNRQLPFQADISGIELESEYPIKLIGPDPLSLCNMQPLEKTS